MTLARRRPCAPEGSADVAPGGGTLRPMTGSVHCARPGCSDAPVAVLTYDYTERVAWLNDTGTPQAGSSWFLCIAHADSLRVPVGWTLDDRRIDVVSLRSSRAS